MTRLYDRPEDFFDQMVDGFVAANAATVRRVHGGVVRTTRSKPGTVAVITGGGSGHYPAFGGLVGDGLAHGAAMGNLFASPSWQQVRSVVKSANSGGGALLVYGNYAGDVLNFDRAQTTLNAAGIRTLTVTVTDDISSAGSDEKGKRRGIAGDLPVLKSAAAAAEEGMDLDEVYRVARKANERTRSFGVAFSGCTLPGADEPLFTVPAGRMAIGMGIHGEPGLGEAELPTATGLARLLVDAVLADHELPNGMTSVDGARAVVLLNGLGSVKYEELFVVYSSVHRLFEERGITVCEPECGELVTSFDMAGVSLTVFWLDDELERLWAAQVSAPGYRKKARAGTEETTWESADSRADGLTIPAASPDSQLAAARISRLLEEVAAVLDVNADELGRIDAVAGDGDHGIGMRRGSQAAAAAGRAAAEAGAGAGTVLTLAGDAWSDKAGGTSGALWGAALEALGSALGDEACPTPSSVAAGMARSTESILEFGARVGDKTMVDALVPFTDAFAERVAEGDHLTAAWCRAAVLAEQAARETASLMPVIGRARPHAERSLGTPDAGAVSFALVVSAVGDLLERLERESDDPKETRE